MTKAMPVITEITETDPLRREANHGLMVAWINANLLDRASHDVRTSTVLYDEDKMFILALPEGLELTDQQRANLYESTSVRFWSKGIV